MTLVIGARAGTKVKKVGGLMSISRVSHLCAVISLGSLAAFSSTPVSSATVVGASGTSLVVGTSAELTAALAPVNAGRRILVRAGTYEVSERLVVPDRTSLVGEGVMSFDPSGLPNGFEAPSRTVIRSTGALTGDVITLGNGASLQRLAIEDVPRSGPNSGNVVAVASRRGGDRVAVSIDECELITPNPLGVTPQGPSGRGVLVVVRNLNLAADPLPHESSIISVYMQRSIIRAPGGGSGVFAANFASWSRINLLLTRNVIGGGLDAAGGVTRPDAVTESSVTIESARNLYRSDSPQPSIVGWRINGGQDAPVPGVIAQASTANGVRIGSFYDRIEGFAQGILAAGGSRASALAQPNSHHSVDMSLIGLRLRTTVADLWLFGARNLATGVPVGDGNSLRLVLLDADGSGPRDNRYEHSLAAPLTPLGEGNRLEVVGDPGVFTQINENISPTPDPQFFTPW